MRAISHIMAGSFLSLALMAGMTMPSLAQKNSTNTASTIDFGDDSSDWAKDGECDDPRFSGKGVASTTLAEDIKRDATDCRAAVEAGRAVYNGEQEAAAFDFGSDFSKWANDGECDDLRFEGPGTATTLLDSDRLADADDCKAAFEAGTIVLIEG